MVPARRGEEDNLTRLSVEDGCDDGDVWKMPWVDVGFSDLVERGRALRAAGMWGVGHEHIAFL